MESNDSTTETGARSVATDTATAERARIHEEALGLPHDVAVTAAENLETSGGDKPGSTGVDDARARSTDEADADDGIDRAGRFLGGAEMRTP